jgi:hypothetical protein
MTNNTSIKGIRLISGALCWLTLLLFTPKIVRLDDELKIIKNIYYAALKR